VKRAALYARVSTAEQTTDMQLDELRVLATQRGWLVVGEFVDQASGAGKRPELERVAELVHRGGVDVVAVWKFDRFARSMRELVNALDDYRTRGVDFFSLRDGCDTTTASGRMLFGVIASLAEFERELIRERVRAGMAAAARRGRKAGRPVVWVDVKRARRLAAKGRGLRHIAKVLGVGVGTLQRALLQP